MDMSIETSELNQDAQLDALLSAVVAVFSRVCGRTDVHPDDDIVAAADMDAIVHSVTLLNQWLHAELATWQVLESRTPRRVAAELATAGAVPPEAVDDNPAVDDATRFGGRTAVWHQFWDTTYRFSDTRRPRDTNTAGWFDGESLTPLPAAVMDEWARTTVERVESLAPDRVVDVGCGTGLILFRTAPRCSSYVGIDFSGEAIRHVRAGLDDDDSCAHVRLVQGVAADIDRLVPAGQDLVLLNSVIQYFSGKSYLSEVLVAAAAVVADGGSVLLGDVRNRILQRAQHAALVTSVLSDRTSVGEARAVLDQSIDADDELLISPGEIVDMVREANLPWSVRILARRGVRPTEMNRFRFDALLSSRTSAAEHVERDVVWACERGELATTRLSRALANGCERMIVRRVPDARTHACVSLTAALESAPASTTLGDARKTVAPIDELNPDEVWTLGAANGYGVAVAPAAEPGFIDLAFWRGRDDWTAAGLLPPRC